MLPNEHSFVRFLSCFGSYRSSVFPAGRTNKCCLSLHRPADVVLLDIEQTGPLRTKKEGERSVFF